MRKISVTGGFTDYAECTITERDGKDLTATTFKAALIPRGATSPVPSDSGTWQVPLVTFVGEDNSTAEIALLVGDSTPPGDYYLWVDIIDNPTVVPVRGCDRDGRAEIVRVT